MCCEFFIKLLWELKQCCGHYIFFTLYYFICPAPGQKVVCAHSYFFVLFFYTNVMHLLALDPYFWDWGLGASASLSESSGSSSASLRLLVRASALRMLIRTLWCSTGSMLFTSSNLRTPHRVQSNLHKQGSVKPKDSTQGSVKPQWKSTIVDFHWDQFTSSLLIHRMPD